jgi:hypothetical protein
MINNMQFMSGSGVLQAVIYIQCRRELAEEWRRWRLEGYPQVWYDVWSCFFVRARLLSSWFCLGCTCKAKFLRCTVPRLGPDITFPSADSCWCLADRELHWHTLWYDPSALHSSVAFRMYDQLLCSRDRLLSQADWCLVSSVFPTSYTFFLLQNILDFLGVLWYWHEKECWGSSGDAGTCFNW